MTPLYGINAFVKPNGLIQMLPRPLRDDPAAAAAELPKISPGTTAPPVAPASFENVLTNIVHDVSAKQAAASEAVTGLLNGQNVSLHQAMIASEEAGVSFQLMVEVRNKLLESYQELMRMQI